MLVHWLLFGLSGPRSIASAVHRQLSFIVEQNKWVLTLRIIVAGEPMVSKIVAAPLNMSSASTLSVKVYGVLFSPVRCEYKSNTPTIWDSAERPSSRVESLSRLAMKGQDILSATFRRRTEWQ